MIQPLLKNDRQRCGQRQPLSRFNERPFGKGQYPPRSPWTVEHRMIFIIATSHLVMTYDDPIH
jgi:hypothetical protein